MTTDVYDQLRAAVQRVAVARLHEARTGDAVQDLRAGFEAEYALEIEGAKAARAYVADAESMLKALASAHYEVTQEKKPVPGVQVKERETLHYNDLEALDWCKEKRLALVPEWFDRKAFEKIAKVTDIGFINRIVESQVQIDSVLPTTPTEATA